MGYTAIDTILSEGEAKSRMVGAWHQSFDGSFKSVMGKRIEDNVRLSVGYTPAKMNDADRKALFPADLLKLFWKRCADKKVYPRETAGRSKTGNTT